MHKVKLLDFCTICENEALKIFVSKINLDPFAKKKTPIIHSHLFGNFMPDENILGKAILTVETLALYAYCEFDKSVIIHNDVHSNENTIGIIDKSGKQLTYESFAIGFNSLVFKREGRNNNLCLDSANVSFITPVVALANPGCHGPFVLSESFNQKAFEAEKRIVVFTPNLINAKLFSQDSHLEGFCEE